MIPRTWDSGSMCLSTDWLNPTWVRRPRSFKYWTTTVWGQSNYLSSSIRDINSFETFTFGHCPNYLPLLEFADQYLGGAADEGGDDKDNHHHRQQHAGQADQGQHPRKKAAMDPKQENTQPSNQLLWSLICSCNRKGEQKPWFSSLRRREKKIFSV